MATLPGTLFNAGVLTASVATVLTFLLIRGVIGSSKSHQKRRPNKRTGKRNYITADEEVLSRFSRAIQCETVSWSKTRSSPEELLKLHALLKEAFPQVYSSPLVRCEVINNYSLLFTVKGTDPSLKPYLLISHLDVVPVTDQTWDVPPFSGEVKDGFIWGRGTLDVKNGVMGSLEALEYLLKAGHCPRRGFFLSFGHDEEVMGHNGAAHIANKLRSSGVTLEFVHDEGLVIVNDFFPGITKPVAMIGVAEKGSLDLELTVETSGGHSSMPPRETSIGILANALSRLEANPMPSTFGSGPELEFFKCLSSEFSYPFKIITSNLWLFGPLLERFLSRKISTNALVRTTAAVTKVNGGTKDNVIPASATATVNLRVHQGDTTSSIMKHLRSCIQDDRVEIKILSEIPPSPIAATDNDSFGYNTIVSSVLDVFPDVAVAPGLLVAGTDSKHFLDITSDVYRFMPSQLSPEDVPRIHGSNERINVKNYEKTINFYYHLMLNADDASI